MARGNADKRHARIDQLIDVNVLAVRRATVVGIGTIGSVVVDQFARHGVGRRPPGRLRLIDGDDVQFRNLVGSPYLVRHVGRPKVQAAEEIIHDIDSDINVSHWNRFLTEEDIPQVVEFARRSDLLCLFADDFGLMLRIADACHAICPQVMAMCGERCDTAEVAFSVPGQTVPLSATIGRRELERIEAPQALGCDTAYVANFVAALSLRLLLGDGRENELLPCYSNTPMYVLGLRRRSLFEHMPPDHVRLIVLVGAPTSD